MSGVRHKKNKRWTGTRADAAWLKIRRACGGEREVRKRVMDVLSQSMGDNLFAGLMLLQIPDTHYTLEPITGPAERRD